MKSTTYRCTTCDYMCRRGFTARVRFHAQPRCPHGHGPLDRWKPPLRKRVPTAYMEAVRRVTLGIEQGRVCSTCGSLTRMAKPGSLIGRVYWHEMRVCSKDPSHDIYDTGGRR